MESQNHYYGHSAALARYVGLERPRHVAGLVQHGWTAVSPLETHFRDFPYLMRAGRARGRSLFVWSHRSRAWTPESAPVATVPIGAPWLYEVLTRTRAESGVEAAQGTVISPVHGIETQQITGDHRAAARRWFDAEGPSTVCIYWSDAQNPALVEAYQEAGHTCVTLGRRTDVAFLGRLYSLLSTHARVVSNRLSTAVMYAANLHRDVAVYGDTMRLASEEQSSIDALRGRWPEFYGERVEPEPAWAVADAELGVDFVREPEVLAALLRWDRMVRTGPWLAHWTSSPVQRALVNVRRRKAAEAATTPAPSRPELVGPTAGAQAMSSLAWVRAAATYLPRPLGRVPDAAAVEPISL